MSISSKVVADLQEYANRFHGFKLTVDGDLGSRTFWDSSKTLNALLDIFEKMHGPLPNAKPDPAPAKPNSTKRVYLEVGHGPQPGGAFDPGAVRPDPAGAVTEHHLNGIVAKAMQARLMELGIDAVIGDPRADNYASGQLAKGCDVMIAIHHNSHVAGSKAQGAEAVIDPRSKDVNGDTRLAGLIADKLALANRIGDRGVKQMRLAVLSGARSVGVRNMALIETYFIQQRPDANPATKDMGEWSRRGGVAAADGVAAFLGVAQ